MATRMRDGALLEAKKAKLKPPPLFKVILLNDDYTPMEFVVIVLQRLHYQRCAYTEWRRSD